MSGGTGARARILVVDDAADTREVVSRSLAEGGYAVRTAANAAEAVEALERDPADIVITDFRMPGASGLDLIRYVRENCRGTEAVMITGYGSIPHAVEALKAGAAEYLAKPFTEEELLGAVGRAVAKRALLQAARSAPEAPSRFPGLVGESGPMLRLYGLLAKAAGVPATVLISGESGTGKELAARAVHYAGPRAAAPFLSVNCGAVPEGLIESELFGHVKGAFTGADRTRAGIFQAAERGTVLLDEVSEMPPAMQVKLLRFLQEREVIMVGSSRPVRVDVRILAATNRNLAEMTRAGRFREDLFWRLLVIPIEVPPLRDRGDDILLLARHFGAQFASRFGKPEPVFTDQALAVLRAYSWPGNVRELESLMQRTVAISDGGPVGVPDLPVPMRSGLPASPTVERSLADVEFEHIRRVLAAVGGNKSRAAVILGIDRKTLRSKLSNRPAQDTESDADDGVPDGE